MTTLTFKFAASGGNATWAAWSTHPTSPATETLSSGTPTTTLGTGNKNTTAANNTWVLTGTWASIFGIPANSTIQSVTSASIQSKCTVFTTGGSTHTQNASTLVDGGTTITVGGTRSFTAVDASFVTSNGVNSSGLTLSAGDSITLTISNSLSNGNSNTATMALQQDQLVMTITYVANPFFANLSLDPARLTKRRFTAPSNFVNLLETTLQPVTTIFRSPVSAHVSGTPARSAYEFAAVNLLVTTLAVSSLPFTPQQSDVISRKPVIAEQVSSNLLTSTLAPVAANPFSSFDSTVISRRRFQRQPDVPNLLTSTLYPTVQLRTEVTFKIAGRKYSPAYFEQQQNLLAATSPAAAAPFSPTDYTVPVRRKSFVRDEPQNLLITFPAVVAAPFVSNDYTVLARRRLLIRDEPVNQLPNLLTPVVSAVLRAPVFQSVRSSFKAVLHQDASNLLLSTLAPVIGNPFTPSEYHVPIKRRAVTPSDHNNLLTSTLAVSQNPFIPFDYTVLFRRKFQLPEEPQNQLLTIAVPPFNSGEWPVTSKRRFQQPRDASNLLLTAAVIPFVPADVPVLSKRRFFAPRDIQNLLPLTQTLGFSSGDWAVPPRRAGIILDVAPNLLVTLFGASNPFPSGDWTVAAKRRFLPVRDAINLLDTTLRPSNPFASGEWPVVYKRSLFPQQDQVNELPLNTRPPFGSGESPYIIPRRRVVYYPDNAFNLPVANIAPSALPPGQSVYLDIPATRRKMIYYPDNAFNLAVINPLTKLPPGQSVYSDIPGPRRRLTVEAYSLNLLTSTLSVVHAPFVSVDYTILPRRKFTAPEDHSNLLLTAAVTPFVPSEFQYQVRRRFVAHVDVTNELPISQAIPFVSSDYAVPIRHKFLSPEDVQNLLPLSQQLPFTSGDWTIGYGRRFVAQIDVNNLLPLTVRLEPFSSGEQHYPPILRSRVPYETFTTFNLPTATFVQPFPVGSSTEQFVFKPRSRVLPEVYINLLTSTLIPPVLVSDPAYTVSLDGINYTMALDGVNYTVGAVPVNYTAEAEGVNYTVGSKKPLLYTVRGKVSR